MAGYRSQREGRALAKKAAGAAMRRIVRSRAPFLALVLTAPAILPAVAQPDSPPGTPPGMASRLAAERPSAVQAGLYSAGEKLTFTLEPYRDRYLLRFAGSS